MVSKELRINGMIKVPEVRLLDDKGELIGVISIAEAIEKANALNLDLVEIAPQAVPPVCKIIDYGKYKFELEKKTKETRKNQKQTLLKEVRMQPKIASGDLAIKTKHVKSFLEDGDKVKVTIRFKGRELAHPELGKKVLENLLALLDEGLYTLEKTPTMEGRQMWMSLSSKIKK